MAWKQYHWDTDIAYCHYYPCLTYIFLAADSEEEAEQSDSAVDDEDSPSEEDNTQDLVDRTRGELGAAIRDAAGTAAGSFIFHSSKFQCIIRLQAHPVGHTQLRNQFTYKKPIVVANESLQTDKTAE